MSVEQHSFRTFHRVFDSAWLSESLKTQFCLLNLTIVSLDATEMFRVVKIVSTPDFKADENFDTFAFEWSHVQILQKAFFFFEF